MDLFDWNTIPCEILIFKRLHQHFTTWRCEGFKVWWDICDCLLVICHN